MNFGRSAASLHKVLPVTAHILIILHRDSLPRVHVVHAAVTVHLLAAAHVHATCASWASAGIFVVLHGSDYN